MKLLARLSAAAGKRHRFFGDGILKRVFPVMCGVAICLAGVAFLAGCTSGFDKQWRLAGQGMQGKRAGNRFEGRWAGHWKSSGDPSSGDKLLCVLMRVDETHYQAWFLAHWHGFKSSYLVDLKGRREGDRLVFSGSHQLPAVFGGEYRYEGFVIGDRFRATYTSAYDNGVFEMQRAAVDNAGAPDARR